MELETELDIFSPIYNSEVKFLKSILLSDSKSDDEKMKAIKTFSEKFTVIPALFNCVRWTRESFRQTKDMTFSHLFDGLWAEKFQPSHFLRMIDQPRHPYLFLAIDFEAILVTLQNCKQYFKFPNSALSDNYEYFNRYSASPPTKEIEEQYQQSLNLYKSLKASESDNIKWFEYLKETNDLKFIIQNVECRIGGRPYDKEMWKTYIKFLKDSNLGDLMFHTYSRYCQLFTDDLKMREKFKNEIRKYSVDDDAISKWKLEIIKIERNFGTLENAISLFQYYFPSLPTELTNEAFESEYQKAWENRSKISNPLLNFVFEKREKLSLFRNSKKCTFKNDAIHQTFSLPTTAISFILKNARFRHLQKLYDTSKYFFARLKTPLCFKIMIGVPPKNTFTFQQNLYISSELNEASESLLKCHVKEVIYIQKTPSEIISSIIQNKIYTCEISILSLFLQMIRVADFLKLISNVQSIIIVDSYVFNEENQNISIPEIIAKMPSVKVAKFERLYKHSPFSATSIVPTMKRKLDQFSCYIASGPNDPKKICEFLKASVTANAIVDIFYACVPVEANSARICISDMYASWKSDETLKLNAKFEVNSDVYVFP